MAAFDVFPSYRGYDTLFDQMVAAIPPGTFYDFSRPIVMWSRKPVPFLLTTDNPGYPVQVRRERLGEFDLGVDQLNRIDESTVVPQPGSLQTIFYLTLGRGRNRITVTELIPNSTGRTKVVEVIATTNTVIYEAFGREISKSTDKAAEQQAALYSNFSTRLLDQLSEVGDILPDLQTLKVLSTKMLIRSFVHFPATEIGVRNEIESVTLNTPVLLTQREGSTYKIETSRIMRTIENQAGKEAHIWFPNLAVTRWLAYISMADNFKNNFTLLSVRDDFVLSKYKKWESEIYFDYNASGQNFLTNLSLEECFNNFVVSASTSMFIKMLICCWTYSLDTTITDQTPIGLSRAYLDSDIPFDSDVPFDFDSVDPFCDGFIGWDFAGRFDGGNTLDTMVSPALSYAGPACGYPGPYTQLLDSNRSDIELTEIVSAIGLMADYTYGPIVGIGLDFTNTNFGVEQNFIRKFAAGSPVLIVVKYVDALNMTNLTGSGVIQILEPLTGVTEFAPVAAGFVYIYYTPTVITPSTNFYLYDGSYSATSDPFEVIPAVFGGLVVVGAISNQLVGVPFNVTVQAVDMYGNYVTDTNGNTIGHVLPSGSFDAGDPTPSLLNFVNGQCTISLTMLQPGTGQLVFDLALFTVNSNTFTVV
jgi:hypothetical protein